MSRDSDDRLAQNYRKTFLVHAAICGLCLSLIAYRGLTSIADAVAVVLLFVLGFKMTVKAIAGAAYPAAVGFAAYGKLHKFAIASALVLASYILVYGGLAGIWASAGLSYIAATRLALVIDMPRH